MINHDHIHSITRPARANLRACAATPLEETMFTVRWMMFNRSERTIFNDGWQAFAFVCLLGRGWDVAVNGVDMRPLTQD